jgi:two-component system CheB/CheR fusion protein
MKVMQAKHLLPIKKDHLFIIPPNKNMAIVDGVLTLKPREAKSIHMPVEITQFTLTSLHEFVWCLLTTPPKSFLVR